MLLFLLSLMWGNTFVPLAQLGSVFFGADSTAGERFSVIEIRLPKALAALLAGAAFGMGGAISQMVLRNVLASPDVLGITSGASLAAVTLMTAGVTSGLNIAFGAIVSALMVAVVMVLLSGRKAFSVNKFVLIGISCGVLLQALIGYTLARTSIDQAQQAFIWITGSLSRSVWSQVSIFAPFLLLLLVGVAVLARKLPALRYDDETATLLGVQVKRTRAMLLASVAILVASATALTGPIAFLAFLSGPLARSVIKTSYNAILAAACVGAVLVLSAHLIGQHLFSAPLPVGVVTAVLGAPYLFWVLLRGKVNV